MYLSKNFNYSEFEKSETAKKYGIDNTIKHDYIRNNIKELVYHILQPLRDKVGVPIRINSGFRCLKLNEKVGGVPTSQHVMGQACDFVVEGLSPYETAKIVVELGLPYDQLILYPTFVHVSISTRERRQLLYNKSYKGKRLDTKTEL